LSGEYTAASAESARHNPLAARLDALNGSYKAVLGPGRGLWTIDGKPHHLLDAMLAGRREQRKRPTTERNALWKRWQEEEQLGPKEIADRWWQQTHEKVTVGAVKQALRRTMHAR
jgi:hypothetical protein